MAGWVWQRTARALSWAVRCRLKGIMEFTQITAVRWRDGKSLGYTMFALGVDGNVYKSIPSFQSAQHRGWLKMADNEFIPADPNQEKLFKQPKEEVTA